jgi:predicted transporter
LKKTEEKNSKENKIERFNFFSLLRIVGIKMGVGVGYFGIGEHSAALI